MKKGAYIKPKEQQERTETNRNEKLKPFTIRKKKKMRKKEQILYFKKQNQIMGVYINVKGYQRLFFTSMVGVI